MFVLASSCKVGEGIHREVGSLNAELSVGMCHRLAFLPPLLRVRCD